MNSSNSSNEYLEFTAKQKHLLFEDDYCGIFLADPPMTIGHIIVAAKQAVSLDTIDDITMERMSMYASLCASALFELLQAQGTNVFMEDWVRDRKKSCLQIHILARFQEDDLNFTWQPKKVGEEELKQAQDKIKDKAFMINYKPPKEEVINMDKKIEEIKNDLQNYLTKQLRRRP